MPTITVNEQAFSCESGTNLRDFLLSQKVKLYNGKAATINCHGHGTCGACAVAIEGVASEPTTVEKIRLNLPPHKGIESGRRLACQVKVLGDIKVTKYDGFWGEGEVPVTMIQAASASA
ncbi:2Fe-2S iron-sulfur cluster binding domain-containing protein [Oscillatoria sp. FACHB-1407]|uniref:2Fe-2S iron-sulfur cluster-binding protein n=1 Tax=Oscillatoria sp. FACHB-1407 TaxID=2692847 RepID=UPI0016892FFC|nr:2Fe-2S iron-sulfur cluster binding domain-containing protein [Oscillatoria sp. FACHB-1407]MBD2465685.1 2Fe-2S iron-sulfur cluster binding domain-containing protein [Oscillatoria sp. FACHB-1407]